MKRKNETFILKAALAVTIVVVIIQCFMLVNVQADQAADVDFHSLTITAEDMNNLGEQMSPDIMAQVSAQIPSCTPSVYLEYYCRYDPAFEEVIADYVELEEEAH